MCESSIVHNLLMQKFRVEILPLLTRAILVLGPLAVAAFSGSLDVNDLHRRVEDHFEPLVGVVVPHLDSAPVDVAAEDSPKTGLLRPFGNDGDHGLRRGSGDCVNNYGF